MPELPVVDLGCRGMPDPHEHLKLVARGIVPAIADASLAIVQGDTSSALGRTLGAAQLGIPVAHVEAGLRSHNRRNPWPEEDLRIAIDALSSLLFAPTELNAANLRRESRWGAVHVTGGKAGVRVLRASPCASLRLPPAAMSRSNWCCIRIPPLPARCRLLSGRANIDLLEPCSHLEMLGRMRCSDLILSDSGGMQEEAPALGIPLLILRDRTERPEGIASGNAVLVGRDPGHIRDVVEMLLANEPLWQSMRRPALPYGDGRAAERIASVIDGCLRRGEPRSPSFPSETGPAEPSRRSASRR